MLFKVFLIALFSFAVSQRLVIEDSGLMNFGENDFTMIFYIQVNEDGPTSSRMFVESAECCETLSPDETDCGTMRLIGGDMGIVPCGVSHNLTLFFPTLYGFNRHGSCLVDITYNANETKLRHRIDFDTIIRKGCVPDGLEPFYDPEEIEPCSSLDQDPFNFCEPVFCSAKYNGLRNYFNPETRSCEKAPTCEEGSAYIPISNSCRKIEPSVTDEDLLFIAEELPMNEKEDQQTQIVCHQGRNLMGTCICFPGWQTVPADFGSADALHFCNSPCPSIFSTPSLIFNYFFDCILAMVIVGISIILIVFNERRLRKCACVESNDGYDNDDDNDDGNDGGEGDWQNSTKLTYFRYKSESEETSENY